MPEIMRGSALRLRARAAFALELAELVSRNEDALKLKASARALVREAEKLEEVFEDRERLLVEFPTLYGTRTC